MHHYNLAKHVGKKMCTYARKAPSHTSHLQQAFNNAQETQCAFSLHNITQQLPMPNIPETFQGSVTNANFKHQGQYSSMYMSRKEYRVYTATPAPVEPRCVKHGTFKTSALTHIQQHIIPLNTISHSQMLMCTKKQSDSFNYINLNWSLFI